MRGIIAILYFLSIISCNRKLLVKNENVVTVKYGSILLIDNEYYFVDHNFKNDDDLLKFILKPDKCMYNLKFGIERQLNDNLKPSNLHTFKKNIIAVGSPMAGEEIRYLVALLKLVQIEEPHDFSTSKIGLQNYNDLSKEYILCSKIETKTIVLLIPDSKH